MPRPTSLALFAVLAGVAALFVAWAQTRGPEPSGPDRTPGGTHHSQVLSMREIEVRGRLVDAATGGAIGDIGVLALLFEHDGTEKKPLDSFAWRTAATRAARSGGPPVDEESMESIYSDPESHMLTTEDGRFQVRISVSYCEAYVDDKPLNPTPWPERDGLYGLLVERPGAAPWILTPPPRGTWTGPGGNLSRHDPHCVWDLGDIRVPSK
jgi:hypothetical protein